MHFCLDELMALGGILGVVGLAWHWVKCQMRRLMCYCKTCLKRRGGKS